MTNKDFNFETWFENLRSIVQKKCGVAFNDEDSVLEDYEAGKDCADVADEIVAEYGGH
jgi:hypothetical protein